MGRESSSSSASEACGGGSLPRRPHGGYSGCSGPERSHRRAQLAVRLGHGVDDRLGNLVDANEFELERGTRGEDHAQPFEMRLGEIRTRRERIEQRQRGRYPLAHADTARRAPRRARARCRRGSASTRSQARRSRPARSQAIGGSAASAPYRLTVALTMRHRACGRRRRLRGRSQGRL
jgi:hypothetical protein